MVVQVDAELGCVRMSTSVVVIINRVDGGIGSCPLYVWDLVFNGLMALGV
jgi:hypothetical protein